MEINEDNVNLLVKQASEKKILSKNPSLVHQTSLSNLAKATSVKKESSLSQRSDNSPNKDPDSFPMSKQRFLQKFDDLLLNYETKEVKEVKEHNIHFLGNSIKNR